LGSYPTDRKFLQIILKIIFTIRLIAGTLITLSSTNWISAWIGLELNLISFIPLIIDNSNQRRREAGLKYFLVQTLGSVFILLSSILIVIFNYNNVGIITVYAPIMLALALKIGAAPLHFWFPATIQGITWSNCFLLMTWQKLAPLSLFLRLNTTLIIFMALASSITGAIGGFNQPYIRKLLAYSSINHLGWLLTSTLINEKMILIYFRIYRTLNLAVIFILNYFNVSHLSQIQGHDNSNNTNILLTTNLLSLGGIPPFLGFIPKWIIITQIIGKTPVLVTILTLSSLITLYFYLRIGYLTIIKSANSSPMQDIKPNKSIIILTIISALPIIIITPLI